MVRRKLEPGHTSEAALAPKCVVGGDLEQPLTHCRLVTQTRAAIERCDERVHEHVFGVGPVAQDQIRDTLDLPSVLREQLGENLWLPPAQRLDGHRFPSIRRW